MLDLRRAFRFSYERPEPGDERHGDWTRAELAEMDGRYVAAVEAAFEEGLESRAAAAATVRVTKPTEEEAIEAAWKFLWEKDGDLPFAAIVEFVQARCPNVPAARVRIEFERRFKRRSTLTKGVYS
jgi:hypothetical protein